MHNRFKMWSKGLALALLIPASAASAQTFVFDFTTAGGALSNLANTPPIVVDHSMITGPLNPFGVTRSLSLQSITSVTPTTLGVAGTFTWFTDAAEVNKIFGNYVGSVQLGAFGAFSFTDFLFNITGGTGQYVNLRTITPGMNSGSGQFFGDPTQPGDVRATSVIRNVGSATIVPEPSTAMMMSLGLVAIAWSGTRRRKARADRVVAVRLRDAASLV